MVYDTVTLLLKIVVKKSFSHLTQFFWCSVWENPARATEHAERELSASRVNNKNELDRNNKVICIMANVVWQHAAHTTNHHLIAAQQEAYQKACLTQNIQEFWRKKSGDWASKQKNNKTEGAVEVGIRTREERVKWT